MGFVSRSRRTAPEPHALTVAPFDVAGRGVGDVPPTVAIETPDADTALFLLVEPEGAGSAEYERCLSALDAFRMGYREGGGRSITAALVAGMEAANDALYRPRAARGRTGGVGLTALAVRGPDAYVIQAGPGQALIAGAGTLIALPPLAPAGGGRVAPRPHATHSPALGVAPTLAPDLFHVDASGGLCAALCHSSYARPLARDDDTPLRSFDAEVAADYLLRMGERARLADGYGVVVSAEPVADAQPARMPPRPAPLTPLRAPARSAPAAPSRPSRRDPFDEPPEEARPASWDDVEGDDDAPVPPVRRRPAPAPRPPASVPRPRSRRPASWDDDDRHHDAPREGTRARPAPPPAWFDDRDDAPGEGADDPAAWDDADDDDDDDAPPRRTAPSGRRGASGGAWTSGRIAGVPTRLMMLLVAILCTFVVFLGAVLVRSWNDYQADTAIGRELDSIAADRARAQALAGRDLQGAYAELEPLPGRLEAVTRTGRQPQRVQAEGAALARVQDAVGNVTRVAPKVVAPLDRLDGKPGLHRLILLGDDGQLYLFDRAAQGEWAVFAFDPIAGKRGAALFATGQVALRNPAGELRGLVWSGGPATSDRTRLFVRTLNGSWQELPLAGLSDRRPTAVSMANDVLYLLDAGAGQIVRVSLRDGTAARIWTNEAAAPDLRGGVDLVADGQTVWVLLADGRVRGFAGGATATSAQLVPPAALPPLRGVAAITTSAASRYLYVAEATGGRVLRIEKASGRIVQVFRATGDGGVALDAIQGMAVDEARGTLYCVTADGVISFPLPIGGM